jgi:hypothetical protein
MEVTEERLQQLLADGRRVEQLHAELLAPDGPGVTGFVARIEPYSARLAPGGELELSVVVANPHDREEAATVRLVLPEGWAATPAECELTVAAGSEQVAEFRVRAGGEPARRARVAADVTLGDTRFGQQAEALVDVG